MVEGIFWTTATAVLILLFLSNGPLPHEFTCWFRPVHDAKQHPRQWEKESHVKLLLTSDLFDINDGGQLPEILKSMLSETGWVGPAATAVWLRDGRAGWPDAYDRFLEVDVPGMNRLKDLGVSRHVGLWINQDGTPSSQTILEDDIVGNVSRIAGLTEVKQAIDEAVLLVVPGGEPYKLLKHLRQAPGSQVWAHARARIDRGELVYLARSAGTIIAGGNVDITGFRSASTVEEAKLYLGDPVNWTGLNLLPGNIALRPHYTPGGTIGATLRTVNNRGNWSDDDFIDHVHAHHPGVIPLPIEDGDYLVYHGGHMKLGRSIPLNSHAQLASGFVASI